MGTNKIKMNYKPRKTEVQLKRELCNIQRKLFNNLLRMYVNEMKEITRLSLNLKNITDQKLREETANELTDHIKEIQYVNETAKDLNIEFEHLTYKNVTTRLKFI